MKSDNCKSVSGLTDFLHINDLYILQKINYLIFYNIQDKNDDDYNQIIKS